MPRGICFLYEMEDWMKRSYCLLPILRYPLYVNKVLHEMLKKFKIYLLCLQAFDGCTVFRLCSTVLYARKPAASCRGLSLSKPQNPLRDFYMLPRDFRDVSSHRITAIITRAIVKAPHTSTTRAKIRSGIFTLSYVIFGGAGRFLQPAL